MAGEQTAAAIAALEEEAGFRPTRPELGPVRLLLGKYRRHALGDRALAVPTEGWDAAAFQFWSPERGFPSGPFQTA